MSQRISNDIKEYQLISNNIKKYQTILKNINQSQTKKIISKITLIIKTFI
jgi:hypothetical protein